MEILYRGQTYYGSKRVCGTGNQKLSSNWVYGGILPAANSEDLAFIYAWVSKIEKFPVWPDTVGRYTGKKDMKGTSIFEGDIVALCFSGDVESSYSKIQWDEANARFVLVGIGTGTVLGFNDLLSDVSLKVVGNIFDNPELVNDQH